MTSIVRSFDGTEISFADSGGDGPAVVMLHGATVTSRIGWETRLALDERGRGVTVDGPTVASVLRAAGARTVLVDARGHGHSGHSSDPDRYRGDAHARDAQAVIDALGVEAVDVVGYSMGAATAARLLGLGEPRLRSVALCGIGVHLLEGGDDGFTERGVEIGRAFQEDAWDGPPYLKYYRFSARLDPVHDFGSIGAALIGMEPVPVDRLAAAEVPVLVLNGGKDDGDGDAASVAAMIPGARAAVIGDGDHAFALSDDAFHAALTSFLRERWDD
jgi:pimeloyl-ACP methyl ester carboxylesterase